VPERLLRHPEAAEDLRRWATRQRARLVRRREFE
jgi:GH24 family phage-related lysozyme (muramidase)